MSDAERHGAARPVPESETVTPPANPAARGSTDPDRDRWTADPGAADEPDVYVPAEREPAVGHRPVGGEYEAGRAPAERDPGDYDATADRDPARPGTAPGREPAAGESVVYESAAGGEAADDRGPAPAAEPDRYDTAADPAAGREPGYGAPAEPAIGREPVTYEPTADRDRVHPDSIDDRNTVEREPVAYEQTADRDQVHPDPIEDRDTVEREPVTYEQTADRVDPDLIDDRDTAAARERERIDYAPAIDPEPGYDAPVERDAAVERDTVEPRLIADRDAVEYEPVAVEPVAAEREPAEVEREPVTDASATGGHAGVEETAAVARERGSDVAHTAADEVKHVARTAREEGAHLAEEARAEFRHIADDARAQLREQAEAQTERVTDSMRRFGDQLGALAEGRTEDAGPLAGYAGAAADELRRAAERVRDGGLDGVLDDTRNFARQRPALFLTAAVVAGFAAGRLLRGGKDAHDEHRDGADDVDSPSAEPFPTGEPAVRTEEETWR
ncbi:hypothetical protein GCM10009830_16440 [Glycomyces endophyticus]|uniref:Uncharacterized protein n=1 Tax=Glycomyces endophyticus TaxID=480996 RepID=A0ABN2GH39_9ACTN